MEKPRRGCKRSTGREAEDPERGGKSSKKGAGSGSLAGLAESVRFHAKGARKPLKVFRS